MDINIAVTDANNITLEVTPTPTQTITIDRGIAGPQGPAGPAGGGDVTGPASSTDNAIARFNGTTGKLIQNSAVTIGDSGNTVISVTDSTNAALRVTQLSTATNAIALLVEDSTNPDTSPFVIDSLGKINVGSLVQYAMAPATPYTQWNNADNQYASVGLTSWQAGTNTQSKLIFGRGDSNIVGDFSNAVDNNDNLGSVHWSGSDGTAFVEAASISALVDGIPGTNDMPGRLVFSTTADGASAPTERMRIDSAGNVGIGGTPTAGRTFTVGKNITGGVNGVGIASISTTLSDVTTASYGFFTSPSTQATSFTLPSLYHYSANQGTIGATSIVTNQYGFNVASTLTGATNNYGFYGNIASGANRYNLYMNGTAANYLGGDTIINGKLGLGAAASPSYGTAGQVLTSAGSGASPTWSGISGGTF